MGPREYGDAFGALAARYGGGVAGVLALLRRHAWLAAIAFVVVFAGAATVAMSLPDVYRATATVLVEHPGTTEGGGKSLIAAELDTRLQTIGQEVLSQARLTALMDSFDLYPGLRTSAPASALDRMRRDIQVRLVRSEPAGRPTTVAFGITFRARDPETVAQVANVLAAFYVEENAKIPGGARLPHQDLTQMQEVYTPRHPDVIRLRAEIAALENPPKATAAVGEEFRILDPAVPAQNAVAPPRALFVALGMGLALAVAAVTVVLVDQLDGSFHSVEELRAFSRLPVLAVIPRIGAPRTDRRRLWLTATPIAIGLALVVLASYHIA